MIAIFLYIHKIFILKMRYLNKRSDFIKINEEITAGTGGPFHNDLGWNDSLLGRLINHTIRKSKIQLKVSSVKDLVSRLEKSFDGIILENKLNSISDESKLKVSDITIYMFFKNLIDGVNSGKSISELIDLTDAAIKNSKSLNNEKIDKELNDFRRFLLGQEDIDSNDTDDSDDSDSNVDDKGNYPLMIKNLRALSEILINYNKTISVSSEINYTIKSGDTLRKIQSDFSINKKKLSIEQIKDRNVKFGEFKDEQNLPAGVKILLEAFGDKKSNDSSNVLGNEDHSSQALKKLKNSINILISSKDKGISVDNKLISSFISESNNTDSKILIKGLFKEIMRYLVGDKKQTIQEKDALFVEGIDTLGSEKTLVIIAEKYARFAKRALQFDKTNLYGGYGELGNSLKSFVESLKVLMTSNSISEGFYKYDDFVKILNEKKFNLSDLSIKVKEFFDNNCKTVISYSVENESVSKIENEMKNSKSDSISFQMDSVVEVIKLFNRAYKLYTVQTITKRSENVDTNTLSEYTSFGGSGESGRSGPYRNNKLFNIWEDGVYSVLGDRKYQAIFTKNANLKLPKVTNPSFFRDEDWEIKSNAGQNLRTFMSKMLDGDNIYRSTDGVGQIHTLIEKYFGTETSKEVSTLFRKDKDSLENTKMANKIYENSTKLEFSKSNKNFVSRSIFMIDCTIGDKTDSSQRTFYINFIENGVVYLTGNVGTTKIQKYLYATKDTKFSVDNGDFPRSFALIDTSSIYTRIKQDDFNNLIKSGSKIKMTNCTSSGSGSIKTDEVSIKGVYWLVNEKDELYRIPKEDKENLKKIINSLGEKDGAWIKSSHGDIKIIKA